MPHMNLMSYFRNSAGVLMFFCLILYVVWTSTGDYERSSVATVTINESTFVCKENFIDTRTFLVKSPITHGTDTNETGSDNFMSTTIYFITPTYPRREQFAEIVRLGQTLMNVPNLHWIVADDTDSCNPQLDEFLNRFGMPYTHISSPMPDFYRSQKPMPRGVANRRAAINWIRQNGKKPGVMYFGDDDNTFDLRLFNEIRSTKGVSMFPVGLIGLYSVSAPIVRHGKVIGFFDSWVSQRLWPVDMAGFAVSLEYLEKSPNSTMPYKAGFEEDGFLRSIGLRMHEIEPKAKNCTEILVWHTQTKKEKPALIHIDDRNVESADSSLGPLLKTLESLGVSHTNPSSGVKAQIAKNSKAKDLTNRTV
ncbi:galactosylgalactosylxylosylprotein 3-beta-glucuronosyltransferase S [Contarinia nasturtii]|uniref:galactosylgalactosylxylosylprotein 3-beta-glucuronosyltransferase S n=1 Tax=Contarinia nasturtii TaxID=265458 RepID=UPI0012D3B5F2|nr:galactosylgalactosylxylosylprotein 3-beta-glucuronosyltransferase S [Contarinia nasturtii]